VPMTIYALVRPGKYALEGRESAEGDGKSGVLAAWCSQGAWPARRALARPNAITSGSGATLSRVVECFCGCGRPVSFTRRVANAAGPKVARELRDWEAIQAAIGSETEGSAGVDAFVDEGRRLYTNLRAVVHDEPVEPGFSNRKVARWLRFSQRSRTRFGMEVLHSGIEQRLQGDELEP
jgi:hypothetical protein